MEKLKPCLWFNMNAEEAVSFYTSIIKSSRIRSVSRYPEGTPGLAGRVLMIEFELEGQPMLALNGGPQFQFTEAISLSVSCDSQEEIDHYWKRLTEGGTPSRCGWLKDKYGLSWQIVPSVLKEWMKENDPVKTGRMMQALLKMDKLDIAVLKTAFDGAR